MAFGEKFGNFKEKAAGAAFTAAEKTKTAAAIGKAKVSIAQEEDKIRKASLKLGKQYYQDHAAGSEPQTEAYKAICQEIDGYHETIKSLQAQIEKLKAEGDDDDIEEKVEEPIEVVDPEDMPEVVDDTDETFI